MIVSESGMEDRNSYRVRLRKLAEESLTDEETKGLHHIRNTSKNNDPVKIRDFPLSRNSTIFGTFAKDHEENAKQRRG